MQQIYRRTPIPKWDFNKVALHGLSPVNLLDTFRISFPKNTSGWLLLEKVQSSITHIWHESNYASGKTDHFPKDYWLITITRKSNLLLRAYTRYFYSSESDVIHCFTILYNPWYSAAHFNPCQTWTSLVKNLWWKKKRSSRQKVFLVTVFWK